MKITIKPYTPFFILIVAAVIMMIGFSSYNSSSNTPANQLPVVSTAQMDYQTDINKQKSSEKQTSFDVKDEIVSLKADIKRINHQLTQLTTRLELYDNDSNAETTLTAEELQTIESTQNDYELINEMNRIHTVNKIENYFSQLPEDAANDSNQEAAIKQLLNFDQHDMASILDVYCKATLCRLELKYNLSEMREDEALDEKQQTGYSTTLSSLLDAAVSKDINEVDQTAVAVIFLGQSEVDFSLDQF
jgi:predicted outer membrane protein